MAEDAASPRGDASPPRGRAGPLAYVIGGMNAIGTVWIVGLMALICADVLGRGMFNHPIPGVPEMVAISIVGIAFLQIPATLRAGRVIATDGFVEWLARRSIRAEQFFLAAGHLLGGVMFAIICAYVVPRTIGVWRSDEFYGNVGVFTFPKWPVFALVSLGTAVMALQYAVLAAQFFGAGLRRRRLMEIDPASKVFS